MMQTCPKNKERDLQCGVYGLEDDELPSEYYKEFLYNLYVENKSLKLSLRKMGHLEDSNSKSICYETIMVVMVVGCLWGVELLIGVVVHVHTSNFNLWWSSSVQLGINGRMVMMLVILARGNDNHAKLCYWDRFVHVILVNGSWKVLNGGRASVIVSGLVVMFLGSSYVDVSCEAIGRRC
ncbi:hypothetical protein Tco_1427586 [Tanacetum coccineum]